MANSQSEKALERLADRRSAMRTIRSVAPYLWPDGNRPAKMRVVLAMVALALAKVIAVITPFFYKAAVDSLAGADPETCCWPGCSGRWG